MRGCCSLRRPGSLWAAHSQHHSTTTTWGARAGLCRPKFHISTNFPSARAPQGPCLLQVLLGAKRSRTTRAVLSLPAVPGVSLGAAGGAGQLPRLRSAQQPPAEQRACAGTGGVKSELQDFVCSVLVSRLGRVLCGLEASPGLSG